MRANPNSAITIWVSNEVWVQFVVSFWCNKFYLNIRFLTYYFCNLTIEWAVTGNKEPLSCNLFPLHNSFMCLYVSFQSYGFQFMQVDFEVKQSFLFIKPSIKKSNTYSIQTKYSIDRCTVQLVFSVIHNQ